jgi:peptidoglycan/LPS O-acetylase OafA/YrhL
VVLAPPHLKSYGASLANAVVSCSNFFFWAESGYFNTESATKPLLHTWSLGVEEQFYVVWPAALVLALRAKRRWIAPALLLVAGAISLALNEIFANGSIAVADKLGIDVPESLATKEWLADGSATIFYLLPFRVFEFAIGAVLVWMIRFKSRHQAVSDACVATGLGLIALSVLTFDESTRFPSYNALIPCAGAALCIYAGQAHRAGVILRNRASVWIGLMSYSIYLVHWPLIVFWRYGRTEALSFSEKAWIAGITLSIAFFMLKWVEQPFRSPSSSRATTALARGGRGTVPRIFAVAASVLVVGVTMWSGDGWAWRFSRTIVAEEMKFKADEFHKDVWKRIRELELPFSDSTRPKMLIVGDSMAADFVNVAFEAGLHEEFEIRSIPISDSCDSIFPLRSDEYGSYGLKTSCVEQHQKSLRNPNWEKADVVVIAFLWSDVAFNLLPSQIAVLRTRAPTAWVITVGPKEQAVSGVDLLNQIARDQNTLKLSEYRTEFPQPQMMILDRLRSITREIGVRVFDVSTLFCSVGMCARFNEFGNMVFYDHLHLTPRGAEFLGQRLRQRIGEYPYLQGTGG